MTDFEYWFGNVVSYCDLVLSTVPQRVWVQGEKRLTSAYDPTEFFEQILGDLHLENLIPSFEEALRSIGAYEPVVAFCRTVLAAEQFWNTIGHDDAQQLLNTDVWKSIETAAKQVLAVPAAQVNLARNGRL